MCLIRKLIKQWTVTATHTLHQLLKAGFFEKNVVMNIELPWVTLYFKLSELLLTLILGFPIYDQTTYNSVKEKYTKFVSNTDTLNISK